MNIENNYTWFKILKREVGFRRCVILYGNVKDLWFDKESGRYLRLSQYLLKNMDGFTIKGRWDPIDGLIFPNAAQLQHFDDSLKKCIESGNNDKGEDYESAEEEVKKPTESFTR